MLSDGDEPRFLTIVEVSHTGGSDRYVVPLTIVAGAAAAEIERDRPEAVVATVGGARRGVMHGAIDTVTAWAMFQAIATGAPIALRQGQLRPTQEPALAAIRHGAADTDLVPAMPAIDRANTTTRLGERFWLKVSSPRATRSSPRSRARPVPQRAHALPARAASRWIPRVRTDTDAVCRRRPPGTAGSTVAILSAFMPHQMDAWRQALGELKRYLEAATAWQPADAVLPADLDLWCTAPPERARATIGHYLESAAAIGRRTAEMHRPARQ